jgi:ribonuclease VapC
MVIDSSALVAILLDEPERRRFNELIGDDPRRLLSVANYVEASVVIESRHRELGGHLLDLLLKQAAIEIVPIDVAQAEGARRCYRRFGKGRHHAGLNLGDCFAYALSELTGEPLLFKGGNFGRTDVHAVIA